MTFCDIYGTVMNGCEIGDWLDAITALSSGVALGLVLGVVLAATRFKSS